MRKHMLSVLTAIVLIFVMVLSGCITIVVPTDAPETGVPTETTKVEPTVKPTESVAPTEKTDAPETQASATSEPATETPTEPPTEAPTEPPTEAPTEPAGPPEAKAFETLPVLLKSHSKNDWDSSIQRSKYVVEWPQFTVLGQDWPEFSKAIEKWNTAADKSGITLYTDNLENARKGFDPNMNNWEDRTEARIQRADEKIFSVFMEHETYRGGAPAQGYSIYDDAVAPGETPEE